MKFSNLRSGGENCPSDLALDRLHGGEHVPEVKAHVSGCTTCTLRMQERTRGFDALDGVDPRKMLAQIRTRLDTEPRRAPLSALLNRLWAPLGAVVALVLIVLVLPRTVDPVDPEAGSSRLATETTRLKGSLALHVFRLHGTDAAGKEALSGDHFAAGDRLRFLVDLPRNGRVRVYGQEASGALYVAWPLQPSTPDTFSAGDRRELPGAVALDDSTGQEALVLVACAADIEPACKPSGAEKLDCPKDCAQVRFVMKKGAE